MRSCSPILVGTRAAGISRQICTAPRRARWKRKNVRRVGLRRRRPPAAGGRRLAVPRGGQRRKRAALGETFDLGKLGIPSATLPAAAHAPVKNSQRQRKEKQRQYDNHPDEVGTIRHGSAATGIAEEHSVPEGRPKSEQALIRRPPSRGGPLHRSAPSAFLFGPCTARFSFGKAKEKWGVHPAGQAPLREQESPVAAVRRPLLCYPLWSLRPSR